MKFSFQPVTGSRLRKGTLTQFLRLPELTLETPLLLLYAKGGSVPHLTQEVLELLSKEPQGIQQCLPSTFNSHNAVKQFQKGIAHFTGLPEYMNYLSIQDPALQTPTGYCTKKEISVWTRTGRATIDVQQYMDVVEAFQPDAFEALANGETNEGSSTKKIKKVVDSTQEMFDDCWARFSKSETLKNSSFFAVIEGGYDADMRKKCARSYAGTAVDGFVINGLHSNGPEVEMIDFEKIHSVLETTLESLPEDKLKVLHGAWTPQNLLQLVEMGVDVYDSSFPFLVTERLSALTFQYQEVDLDSDLTIAPKTQIEMSLSNIVHRDDFSPLVAGCTCLTCTKHTRAYVYHLINNKELLAHTLLTIHNLHYYLEFFKAIRTAISNNHKISLK